MNTQCLCIDFGNSFTKLALRVDRDQPSDYLRSSELDYDRGLNLCIPTMAVRVVEGNRERWFFGADALDVQPYTTGATYFRDWKRDFFAETETELDGSDRAGRRGNKSATIEELDVIARGFFRWVREFAEEVMRERGFGSLDEVSTRISIPSFSLGTEVEYRLLSILGQAGFHVASCQPSLPEPLANAIGVFTDGRNVVKERESDLDMEGMFWGTRLQEIMQGREDGMSGAPRAFWTLIADLGAYTLDFAMLGFSTTDPRRTLRTTFYGRERFGVWSEPLGISDLYRRIRDGLYPAKRPVFDELVTGRLPEEQTQFYENLFLRQLPFEFRDTGMVIGEQEEGVKIREAIQAFSDECGKKLKAFLDHHRYTRVDDVVLTGGGMNIPQVRDAIYSVAASYDASHGYVPAHPEEDLSPVLERIDQYQVRGATALGGASIFFDEAEEILNS